MKRGGALQLEVAGRRFQGAFPRRVSASPLRTGFLPRPQDPLQPCLVFQTVSASTAMVPARQSSVPAVALRGDGVPLRLIRAQERFYSPAAGWRESDW